ncbi:MAG: hypothetical protein AABW65_03115 [Nanoarchaeota archaeon]
MEVDGFLNKIKSKKELSGISDFIILSSLEKYFKKNKISKKKLSSKDSKLIVKEIRSDLRKLLGRFEKDSSKRKTLLETNKIDDILNTHISTKERKEDYPLIISLIKELNPNSILDIGCGLNPLALASSKIVYYALDINKDEIDLINNFFKRNNIKGKAFFHDLRNYDSKLPEVDLCLLLKVLDIIEEKGHKLAEKIIKNLKCKCIIISFSVKTLSGKPMNHPQRGWIERLLNRLGYSFNLIKTKNEIFYIASPRNCQPDTR